MDAWAFRRKHLTDIDAEDFLVFADSSLVMDKHQRLPSDVMTEVKHAESSFEFIEGAGVAGKGFAFDLVELPDLVLGERRKVVEVLSDFGWGEQHRGPPDISGVTIAQQGGMSNR